MSRIGYARVSTIDQNLDRQLELLSNCDKIFTDKASGKNLERAGLQKMLDYIREGDIVVVTELKRLGRNNKELTETMYLIQSKNATLEVLNLPVLTGIEDDNLRRLLNNLIIELYKYQAEEERQSILTTQRQGIELAKKRGVYQGKQLEYSETARDPKKRFIYKEIVRMLEEEVSISEIAKRTGTNRSLIYRIKKRIEY
ncbi:recombinase family protein [Enterococcus xiangfangensis]|uniref:Recombinase family protein n=1 Tax=Enterococcus xiangfangensis TaxID=1296537 RepID=A0ABU3FD62_9ENTE|nr:recombinase family protein [Enterococcus xiangfangensis]MDT2760617.1 recombinase family protein [Enterococcus xiangfangensis]